jgi:hypothetical protein
MSSAVSTVDRGVFTRRSNADEYARPFGFSEWCGRHGVLLAVAMSAACPWRGVSREAVSECFL